MARIALIKTLVAIGLASVSSCKSVDTSGADLDAATKVIPWRDIKVGQAFRMHLPSRPSACYIPGTPLTLGNCGDLSYWRVKGQGQDGYYKTLQSVINGDCLTYNFKNEWFLAGCSDLGENQLVKYDGGRLVPALAQKSVPYGGGQDGPAIVTKEVDNDSARNKQDVISDPIAFTVSDSGKDEKHIFLGGVKKARGEQGRGFVSEVNFGNVKRIVAIYVATVKKNLHSPRDNSWISGIQVHYENGTKTLFGVCDLDSAGNCIVNNADRPKYPNPLRFDKDEYVTSLGMKFAQGDRTHPACRNDQVDSTRLVELMVKTNKTEGKSASGQKMILWKGLGDGAAPWQWLTSKPGHVIVGFYGMAAPFSRLLKWDIAWNPLTENPESYCRDAHQNGIIQSLGVIESTLEAYRAHNQKAYATKPSRWEDIEQNARTIGDSLQNISAANCRDLFCEEGRVKALKAKETLAGSMTARYSSTLYTRFAKAGGASNPTRTTRLAVVKFFFNDGLLSAIQVHPEKEGALAQPETYGELPANPKPSIHIELGEGEFITMINWKKADTRKLRLKANLIGALKVRTNFGRDYSFDGVPGAAWAPGLQAPGYAIAGFHGIHILKSDPAAKGFPFYGILNMGAWLVKESIYPPK